MLKQFSNFIFVLCFGCCIGQTTPQPPLEIPLLLSGTFGELRSNHFHSGLDIKTKGRQGFAVRSIESGYVSRIKIQEAGFGKVLYITHPSGITSVYAHLQKFAPEIEKIAREIQYQKESYTFDLYPTTDQIEIEANQIIAYSGNTGSSGGPHLHFEIRDSETQEPLNPLSFSFQIDDHQPPTPQALWLYNFPNDVEKHPFVEPTQIPIKKINDSTFVSDIIKTKGSFGFGIQAFDRQDLTYNKNGVYRVQTFANGNPYIEYKFDRFSFEESSYINTLIDHSFYKTHRNRIQKLFKTPSNRLRLYEGPTTLLSLGADEEMNLRIVISDFEGNTSTIHVSLVGSEDNVDIKTNIPDGKPIETHRDYLYTFDLGDVYFPKEAFFENTFVDIKQNHDTLYVVNKSFALKKNIKVTFEDKMPTEGGYLGLVNGDEISFVSSTKRGNAWVARTKSLGKFVKGVDSVAPTISPINFSDGKWVSNYQSLSFKIKDAQTGIGQYRGTIDGKWALFEYEYKNNLLTFHFDSHPLEGTKHLLELVVTDKVGNETVYKAYFYRKTTHHE